MAIAHDSLLNTDVEVADSIKDQYLTFEIDGEDFGIEISTVSELIPMQPITKVPEMPYYIEGITSLRGDLIGVLDVRKRFGKPPKDYDEATCIVVIMYEDYLLGLIVDAVKETTTIPEANITAPPSAKLSRSNMFIRNIGRVDDSVRLLLDLEKFLTQDV
jgi:purine-binding chemotaxis protein CheW